MHVLFYFLTENWHFLLSKRITPKFTTTLHFVLNLPEVSLQFFLLKQRRHYWPHENFIGNGPNHKVTEDTHRANPSCAASKKTFL